MKPIFSDISSWQQNDSFYSKFNMTNIVSTSFTSKMQENLFDIEDKSWWFQHRGNIIKTTAKKLNKIMQFKMNQITKIERYRLVAVV